MEEGDRKRSWSVLGRPCGGRAVVGSQAVLNSLQRMGVEGQKSWKFLIFGNHPPRRGLPLICSSKGGVGLDFSEQQSPAFLEWEIGFVGDGFSTDEVSGWFKHITLTLQLLPSSSITTSAPPRITRHYMLVRSTQPRSLVCTVHIRIPTQMRL